ncbi:MAG: adenosylcobalamin-dependent ribonucleoside-diphosphate reductase, partial [Spirochaetes bacterium]|nr:adenosylcobalamin-dependent ribonucleoside-diphosphate reductase [Spirochaetota bacterium]
MEIQRRFTREGDGPYSGISFESRISEIRNPDGKAIFRQEGVVVPSQWSQIATDILAQKYFRKRGVPRPDGSTGGETDARQVFHRMAFTWTDWGRRYGYFSSEADAQAFSDELAHMLARQMGAPNSPQWFNTGLFAVYGMKGPAQGHYFVDPATDVVEKATSAYERPQPHACFILSVEDDLVNEGGIMDLITREARLFKYGSGTGSNYSKLRSSSEPLSGGGVSSGLLSFLKVSDRSASSIKSGGTTRRAARMVTLDADHPDVLRYIDWKAQEERKVAAMVAGSRVLKKHTKRLLEACKPHADGSGDGGNGGSGGSFDPKTNRELERAVREAIQDEVPPSWILQTIQLAEQGVWDFEPEEFTTDWDSEAYNTVSGQASNNSLRLTDAFMKAVIDDGGWDLVNRTDGAARRKVKAREIWEKVAMAAWLCADPGLQFHTTINDWHTCPADGEIRASNPCSEYMFLDDTACNLASLNLLAFYDREKGEMRIEDLRHAIRLWTVVLEISVLMAQFPSAAIARNSCDFRTLGLGFANLGTLLMVMGIPYDSAEGRAIAAALSSILTAEAYATSAEMAAELGPFSRYPANRECMLRVVRNHGKAAYGASPDEYEGLSVVPQPIDALFCPPDLMAAARKAWDRALALGEKHGYRNAQVTAIAPTGTIGLVMDCDTTGIEPDFSLVKFKKLAGGGYFKIINGSIPPALRKLGYPEEQIGEIVRSCLGHGSLDGAPGISSEKLREKGFTEAAITKVNGSLANAFSITFSFAPHLLGKEFLSESLKIPETTFGQAGFSLLTHLGFSKKEI